MVLPDSVALCDAVELAAIVLRQNLFIKDLAKQFYPGQNVSDVESEIKDILALAGVRQKAIPNSYPFTVTDRSIEFKGSTMFDPYVFLLLGSTLGFGGPAKIDKLRQTFQRLFEDVVCWSFRNAGLTSEVLSKPRRFRGLPKKLPEALREISNRFKEGAVLDQTKLTSHDNDLDVDILVCPFRGNDTNSGWPTIQVQCITGPISSLQSKLQEGSSTFSTVWKSGFYAGSRVRAVATPDDLLKLDTVYWHRLNQVGWVLDRTRIIHLSAGISSAKHLKEVTDYWAILWAAQSEIDWQTGWQGS